MSFRQVIDDYDAVSAREQLVANHAADIAGPTSNENIQCAPRLLSDSKTAAVLDRILRLIPYLNDDAEPDTNRWARISASTARPQGLDVVERRMGFRARSRRHVAAPVGRRMDKNNSSALRAGNTRERNQSHRLFSRVLVSPCRDAARDEAGRASAAPIRSRRLPRHGVGERLARRHA